MKNGKENKEVKMDISVSNLRSPKSGLPVVNQYEIRCQDEGHDLVIFQSYNTKIAEVDYRNMVITVSPFYNYSQTTNKYRNEFFRGLNFHELADTNRLRFAIKRGWYSPLGAFDEWGRFQIKVDGRD